FRYPVLWNPASGERRRLAPMPDRHPPGQQPKQRPGPEKTPPASLPPFGAVMPDGLSGRSAILDPFAALREGRGKEGGEPFSCAARGFIVPAHAVREPGTASRTFAEFGMGEFLLSHEPAIRLAGFA